MSRPCDPFRARASFRAATSALAALLVLFVAACGSTQSSRVRPEAIYDFRAGAYDRARRELRRPSIDERSPDVILDNLRLAVAALHDGAFFEAKYALRRAYPYLVTGTVNRRSAENAPVFMAEGRRVWKGEPFEQAAAWYYQAALAMIEADWENARAASKNMLFTLVDFAGADNVDEVMKKAESPEWFNANAEEVESDLVLGYLILGIAEHWQQRFVEAEEAFTHAETLRPDLAQLITRLRLGDYNTLLIVEAEEGPRKVPRGEYFTFEPKSFSNPEQLIIDVAFPYEPDEDLDSPLPDQLDVVDFQRLAQHPRWWSTRSLRETRKAIGSIMSAVGTGAVLYGVSTDNRSTGDKVALAGAAAILLGEALAHSAEADQRYLDVLPRTVYLVPLNLQPGPHTVRFSLPEHSLRATRHFIMPGEKTPAVYLTRLESASRFVSLDSQLEGEPGEHLAPMPPIAHPNDITGPIPGTYPYILGGTCVCTPTQEVLAGYQAGGHLTDYTLADLLHLYRGEGIVFEPLPASRETTDTYHHVLRDGRLLYTPIPGSAGFEHLTFESARPYEPRSEALRRARMMLADAPDDVTD